MEEVKTSKIFSHSRLSSFEQCKLKYKFRYIDKIIPDVDRTIESHLGSVVHSVLEWLYKEVKNNKIPSVDDLIVCYSNFWKEDYDPEINIIKKQFTVMDYFNKGIGFLINYHLENHPFDDNTLEIEKEIIFDLDEGGNYKIRGFIDRLSYNIKTNEYEIHDYKTSSRLPNDKDLEKDRQLAFYSIAIKEIYGNDKEIRLVWHYLSFNKKLDSKRTDEQLSQLKKDTLELIRKIESTINFNPTKSGLCPWCEYKPICPAWGNKMPGKQTSLDDFKKENSE